jgi:DNA repair protein RecO (recombination protein O)
VKSSRRVWLAPAYVLHQYAYRDTSRILEVFTGEFGRLSLFARGAQSPKSLLRGLLRPFQRLLVSWSGKGEAGQLLTAELDGAITQLPPQRLMSGFYLNELLLKLTERWDAHPQIFGAYADCVGALSGGGSEEPALRGFEKRLLDELGYGLELSRTVGGEPIEPARFYRFALESGLQPCLADTPGAMPGQSLADLDSERFEDARSLKDAKRLLRAAIDACLDGRVLKSREVAVALKQRDAVRAAPVARP